MQKFYGVWIVVYEWKNECGKQKIRTKTDENISIDAQIFPVQEFAFHC